jgi:hypothetical protein
VRTLWWQRSRHSKSTPCRESAGVRAPSPPSSKFESLIAMTTIEVIITASNHVSGWCLWREGLVSGSPFGPSVWRAWPSWHLLWKAWVHPLTPRLLLLPSKPFSQKISIVSQNLPSQCSTICSQSKDRPTAQVLCCTARAVSFARMASSRSHFESSISPHSHLASLV